MRHEQMAAIANPEQARSGMTRDEIVAFFERRQELYEDLDAAALAADYAAAAGIGSPSAGVHTGRAAAERTLRGAFDGR